MGVYKVYCDESRHNGKHLYRLLGSLWVPSDLGWQFIYDYQERCKRLGGRPSHLTFKKNTPPNSVYMKYYESLVDLYFEYADRGDMRFRTIVVERSQYQMDHPLYASGDFEIGLSQLYYQLLIQWIGLDDQYHIRIAKRGFDKSGGMSVGEYHRQLRESLNAGTIKKNRYRVWGISPVKTIEERLADDRLLIQLADVFMGATGYHWNKEHLKDKPSAGKCHLASYVASKLGWETLDTATARGYERFNIFHFKPRKIERPTA